MVYQPAVLHATYTCDRLNVFVMCTSVFRVVLDVAVLGDVP